MSDSLHRPPAAAWRHWRGALLAWPAAAQDRVVPSSAAELQLSFAPVVKRVAPAVVNVYAAKTVENRNPLFEDPFFRRFFGADFGPRGRSMQRSLGSGVIVDADRPGRHQQPCRRGRRPGEGLARRQARIRGRDRAQGSAHRPCRAARQGRPRERFPRLEFGNSDELQVGDLVLAIGNPFGVGQTVTHGIVSALARTQVGITDYQFFIQTDAAINPGNSGGALVDMTGRLVGINTAIFSRSGGSQGIGFAIPANMVQVVVASARGGGTAVKRPWLGAKLQAVTPEIAEGLGLKRPAGALVASVAAASPGGQRRTQDRRRHRLGRRPAGRRSECVRLPLRHPSARRPCAARRPARRHARPRLPLRCRRRPSVRATRSSIKARSPFTGAKVANLSPALADELRLDPSSRRRGRLEITTGSPAQRLGFQRGDVVISINNEKRRRDQQGSRAR